MSRIGKLPILLPNGVKVDINGLSITVSGTNGQMKKQFSGNLAIEQQENAIIVKPLDEMQETKAMWGTARSIIDSMVKGVQQAFKEELEIHGVGYRAAVQQNYLNLALGRSHSIKIIIPEYIKIEIPKPTAIILSSIDKEKLGQFTALVIDQSPPEPYKGKGIRKKGQSILRKEGKKSK